MSIKSSLSDGLTREFTLKSYVSELKKNYDYILIDCMPSLGMLTIANMRTNLARAAENSLKQNYGRVFKVYQTVIPFAVKAAETSTSGKSIYSYDKNSSVSKAYMNLRKLSMIIMNASICNNTNKEVKTGDNARLAPWIALMILSAIGITGVNVYSRKKRTNE